MGGRQRRTRRGLAQAGQERVAAPQAQRQGRGRDPQDPRQALPQLWPARRRTRRRGRVPDLHERLRDRDRAAHGIPRPARRRELQHADAPVPRGHRRGPGQGRRAHGGAHHRQGRPGLQERADPCRRPHRRRGPGQGPGPGRHRLAHRRRGRADPRTQGHHGAARRAAQGCRQRRQAGAPVDRARAGQARGAGRQALADRGRGRHAHAPDRRDLAADLLPRLRRPSPRRCRLPQLHPRRRPAAGRTQGRGRRRRGGGPARQRRRFADRGHRPHRPVHRPRPGGPGARCAGPRERRSRCPGRRGLGRAARGAGQSQLGLGLGDLRGRAAGLWPRADHRRDHVRQGHGAEPGRPRQRGPERRAGLRPAQAHGGAVLPRQRRLDPEQGRGPRRRLPDHLRPGRMGRKRDRQRAAVDLDHCRRLRRPGQFQRTGALAGRAP